MTRTRLLAQVSWLATLSFALVSYLNRTALAGGPFSEMVVFGASFDDPTSRFTNGPLWNEWLASELDISAPTASRSGGTNYSVSGQTTSQLRGQVRQYLRDHIPIDSTLLTFSFGAMGNDFRVNRRADPARSAANVANMITQLADAGGSFFMVPKAAQAGLSPINRSQADAWAEFFVNYDAALDPLLSELESNRGLTIYRPDIFQLTVEANEHPETYGLTNTRARADQGVNNTYEYMWWDNWHPTTAVHRLAGHEAFKAMDVEIDAGRITLGRSQSTYRQDFEELSSGRLNTPLPDGWVGVTGEAVYTSITGSSSS